MNKQDIRYSYESLSDLLMKKKYRILDKVHEEAQKQENPKDYIEKYCIAIDEFREQYLERYL